MSVSVLADDSVYPLTLIFHPIIPMDTDRFFAFCQINRDVRMEQTSNGEVIVMAPAGGESGARNNRIALYLGVWAEANAKGIAFDSSTGFVLPNGATRAPDASWVLRSRLAALTPAQKQKFLPLCPDFVVELRSVTDRLSVVQEKMEEYRANGCRLGWLIDPLERKVYIYRSMSDDIDILDEPASLDADPALPGFTLPLAKIWDPGF